MTSAKYTERFQIIVGVSVADNFQIGKNIIKLLTEYENVTQKFYYLLNKCCNMLNNFNMRAFHGT
jgi:hypothetical protein